MTEKPNIRNKAFMLRALALARCAAGQTWPNPLVGAVVVKDGAIVGTGLHRAPGGDHAEVEALRQAGELARGAEMFVTLEPCNHYGKTPPCTDCLIKAGIAKVHVAMRDPNRMVKGGGVERLREEGIQVELGLLGDKAKEINLPWCSFAASSTPFAVVHLTLSVDGSCIVPGGAAGPCAAAKAQEQRFRRHFDAVITDAETAFCSQAGLYNSHCGGFQPLRIVVDEALSLPDTAYACRRLSYGERGFTPSVIAAAVSTASPERRKSLELHGVEVLMLDDGNGGIDFSALFDNLSARGVQGVYCIGGGPAGRGLLKAGLCQRLLVCRLPAIIAPPSAESALEAEYSNLELKHLLTRRAGSDALSIYELV